MAKIIKVVFITIIVLVVSNQFLFAKKYLDVCPEKTIKAKFHFII